MTGTLVWKHAVRLMAVGFIAVCGACDWFGDPTPETVRVSVSGETGKTVQMLVSQDFAAGTREDGATVLTVFLADTLTMTLPFDSIFRLLGPPSGSSGRRFFFQVERATEDLTSVQVRAFLDGRATYDESGVLEDNLYRFAYSFNQPIFNIEEVLF